MKSILIIKQRLKMISESYWSRIAQDNEIYNFDLYCFFIYFYRGVFNA